MNKEMTELVFILDRSGSMAGLEQDTIGSFSSMLRKQKNEKGQCLITTVLFDTRSEILHDRIDIQEIASMTQSDYVVRGCTALLDALGSTIDHIAMIHKYARPEDVPAHTMFVITTDGMENASRRYGIEQVRTMVKQKQEQNGWEFLFLGANMDAVTTANNMGIRTDRAAAFTNDAIGVRTNYEAVSEAIRTIRSGASLPTSWKENVEKDHNNRKNIEL